MKTRYSQAMRPSSAAPVIQSTTRYRPLRQGATLLSSSGPEFRRQKSFNRSSSTLTELRKNLLETMDYPFMMIAPHHPPRHLPRVRLDASQTADFRQLLFFCNLNKPPHRNRFDLNKAIPERSTIPTPGAASQGCLCKYPPAWASALRAGGRKEQEGRSAPSSCLLKFLALPATTLPLKLTAYR